MPRELLCELRVNSTSGQVADERVPERMEVGDAGVGRVANPRRFQVDAKHLGGFVRPRSRKQTLWLHVCRTIERQDGSLVV